MSRMNSTTAAAGLLLTLGLFSGQALADAYLLDSDGRPLRNERGQCWRTVEWRPDLALRECDLYHWEVAERARRKKKESGFDGATGAVTPAAIPADEAADAVASADEANAAPAEIEVEEVVLQPLVLNTDTSFRFGDYRLMPEARDALQGLAGILLARQAKELHLRITGHTDRIGSAGANQALGLKRAQAIKAALIEMGLDDAQIEVVSKGASEPVTQVADCPSDLARCELIDCLRPDRRVTVETRAKVETKRRSRRPAP